MLSNFKAAPEQDRIDTGKEKLQIFESCQQEILAFVTKCVSNQTQRSSDGGGMTGILDESKYVFVDRIKERIRGELEDLIDQQLQADTSAESMIPIIVDKILASKKYLNLVNQVASEAQQTATELLKQIKMGNSAGSGVAGAQRGGTGGHSLRSVTDSSLSGHSAGTVESCSLGSLASGICPKDDELQSIVDQLHPRQPYTVRFAAVQLLASFSVGELLADEFWPVSKIIIQLAILDADVGIATIGMEIYARSFKMAPPYMIPEVYISFAGQLITLLQKSTVFQSSTTYSLKLSDQRVSLYLKLFRLLDQFMIHVPLYWFRFNENVSRQVMDITGQLLKTSQEQVPQALSLSSIHFLAMVDPRALWYHKWTLSHIGRTLVLSAFDRCGLNPLFARNFSEYANTILQSCKMEAGRKADMVEGEVGRDDVDYVYFLHLVSILKKLVLCSAGRNFFPIRFNTQSASSTNTLDISTFILKLVQLVSCDAGLAWAAKSGKESMQLDEYSVSRFCSQVLRELASAEVVIQSQLLREEFLIELMNPVKAVLEKNGKVSMSEDTLLCIAETLSYISITDSGRQFLLWGESRDPTRISQTNREFLDILCAVLDAPLSNKGISRKVVGSFMFLLRQLYRTYEGIALLFDKSNIAVKISSLKSINQAGQADQEAADIEWSVSVIDNLLNFGVTPKGILLLERIHESDFTECIQHMFMKKRLKVSKCERFGYGTLVSQIATTTKGMMALCKVSWVSSVIVELYNLLMANEVDAMIDEAAKVRLQTLDYIDIDDQEFLKPVGNLMKLITTFQGISACLEYERKSGNDEQGQLTRLLNDFVLCDLSLPSPFVYPLESRQLGLRVLKHCMSGLDSMIYLETKFNINECLILQHRDSFVDSIFIQDENSLLVNYLLVSSKLTGGSAERKLPPLLPTATSDIIVFTPESVYEKFSLINTKSCKESDSFVFEESKINNLSDFECEFLSRITAEEEGTGTPIRFMSFFCLFRKFCTTGLTDIPLLESSRIELGTGFAGKCWSLAIDKCVDYARLLLPHHPKPLLYSNFFKVLGFVHDSKLVAIPLAGGGDDDTTYCGFDWFLATLFILCDANVADTCSVAHLISQLSFGRELWALLLPKNENVSQAGNVLFCHQVEEIVAQNIPLVASSFTLSGCTVSQVVQRWHREVYWNILNFTQIKVFLMTSLFYGIGSSALFAASLFEFASSDIVKATREEELLYLLQEESSAVLRDCRVSLHLMPFIKNGRNSGGYT